VPTFNGTARWDKISTWPRWTRVHRLDAVLYLLDLAASIRAFSRMRSFGEAARNLFEDAQAMLKRLIDEKKSLISGQGGIGLSGRQTRLITTIIALYD